MNAINNSLIKWVKHLPCGYLTSPCDPTVTGMCPRSPRSNTWAGRTQPVWPQNKPGCENHCCPPWACILTSPFRASVSHLYTCLWAVKHGSKRKQKTKSGLFAGLPWLSRCTQPSTPFCPLGEGPDIDLSDPPPLVLPFVVHKLKAEDYPSHTLSVPWGTGGMFYKTLIVRDSRFPENSRAKTHGR